MVTPRGVRNYADSLNIESGVRNDISMVSPSYSISMSDGISL